MLSWRFACRSLVGVGYLLFAPGGLTLSWLFACPSLIGARVFFALRAQGSLSSPVGLGLFRRGSSLVESLGVLEN